VGGGGEILLRKRTMRKTAIDRAIVLKRLTFISRIKYRNLYVPQPNEHQISRLIELFPSRDSISDSLVKKFPHLNHIQSDSWEYHNFLTKKVKRIDHLHDILYVVPPSDYAPEEHAQLSRYLRMIPAGWVLNTPFFGTVKQYYSWARCKLGMISNDVYCPLPAVFEKEDGISYIKLTSVDYKLCERSSFNLWSNETEECDPNDKSNQKDPRRAERHHKLAEMALAKVYNKRVNMIYQNCIDESDFLVSKNKKIGGEKILIKIRKTQNGVDTEIYVVCFVLHENIEESQATIGVVGWTSDENSLVSHNHNILDGMCPIETLEV
jgi:hypothetical protein